MARSPAALALKWQSGFQQAIPDAKDNFASSINKAKTNYKSKTSAMRTNYAAAMADNVIHPKIDAAFTVSNMATPYNERLDQISVTGLTSSQVAKVEASITLKRHFASLITGVRTLLDSASSGNPEFKISTLPDQLKDTVIIRCLNAVQSSLSTNSSASNAVSVFKLNIADTVIARYLKLKS